jgi:hypothetical protein
MALENNHVVTDIDLYRALRLAILTALEGNEPLAYYDNAAASAGGPKATIGIGFNLADSNVRNRVLDSMIIYGPQRAQLESVLVNHSYNGVDLLSYPVGFNPGQRNYELRAALAAIYGQPFSMTPAQIVQVFLVDADARELNIFNTSGFGPNSLEKIGLLSSHFNGVYKLGLQQALRDPNPALSRVRAWIDIRYLSNGGTNPSDTVARRRYKEAALLGLYDSNGVSSIEALDLYREVTARRETMFIYEVIWPPSMHSSWRLASSGRSSMISSRNSIPRKPLWSAGSTPAAFCAADPP